jgi:acyl-CoA hydrolase
MRELINNYETTTTMTTTIVAESNNHFPKIFRTGLDYKLYVFIYRVYMDEVNLVEPIRVGDID